MIFMTVTALLAITSVATAIALADNWVRGRNVFEELVHERALMRAGFVPVVNATELRQRPSLAQRDCPSRRARLPRGRAGASPAFTKRAKLRAPRPAIAPLGEALGAA